MKFGIHACQSLALNQRVFQLAMVIALSFTLGANAFENETGLNPPAKNPTSKTARDIELHKAGLKVQWFTQAGIGVTGRLVDWYYFVDENNATTYFQIAGGNYTETFSEKDLSPAGVPFGVTNGLAYAQLRREAVEAELAFKYNQKIEVKVTQYKQPQTTLYTLTSGALVRAIDAETGKTLWKVTVDDPNVKCFGVAASADKVVAAVGSSIHCLDAITGKPRWKAHCRSIISGPPSVRNNDVFVPLFNGQLEWFSDVRKGLASTAFVTSSPVRTRPYVSGLTVAWGNDQGDFSVGSRNRPRATMGFQLKTNYPVVAPPAYRDRTYYVVSRNGFFYAIEELTGQVKWEMSTGGSISQSPQIIGNHAFVINDRNEMFKIELGNGVIADGWDQPKQHVAQFLAASQKNMYLLDEFGKLQIRDVNRGTLTNSIEVGPVAKTLPHLKSDRIFLVDRQGTIRCIREASNDLPYFHENVDPQSKEADSDKDKDSEEGNIFDEAKPEPEEDIFGGG